MHSPYLLIFFSLGSWEMTVWTVDLGGSIAAIPSKLESLPSLEHYTPAPGTHVSPMRLTSAMNFELEIDWQEEADPAVTPGVGTWSSGE